MNGTIGTKLRSNWPIIILALTLAACMTVAAIINGIIHYNSINNNDSYINIHYKKHLLINTFSEDAIKSWKSVGDKLTTNKSNNISKKILYWNFNDHEKYIHK